MAEYCRKYSMAYFPEPHVSQEELDRFYSEPPPTVPSDLEVAMEEVHDKGCWESTQRSDQPIPPSRAEEMHFRDHRACTAPGH